MVTVAVYEHTCAEEQRRRTRAAVVVAALIGLFVLATYQPAPPPVTGDKTVTVTETVVVSQPGIYSDLTTIGPAPPPRASIAPSSISFGRQQLGAGSPAKLITVVNEGGHLLDVDVSNEGDAFAITTACPRALDEKTRCTIAVVFSPRSAGAHQGAVTIAARGQRHRIALSGVAFAAEEPAPTKTDVEKDNVIEDDKEQLPAIIDPVSIVFESPGREIVRISNPNQLPLRVTGIKVVDGNARGFQMPGLDKCIRTLAPQGYCEFAVIALPNTLRRRESIRLEVSSE